MKRISPGKTHNSRELRKNMTHVERLIWHKIRARQLQGVRFRRQYPIGRYIVDFICLEQHLIIELDGGQHAEQQNYDTDRDIWLTRQGFKVLRFWNNEVLENMDGIVQIISKYLPPSQPSP